MRLLDYSFTVREQVYIQQTRWKSDLLTSPTGIFNYLQYQFALILFFNNINLLEPQCYVTGKTIKNTRWRRNDNLLGTKEFCPIIRKLLD